MTPRARAQLALIAADLARQKADRVLKQCCGHVSAQAVSRVLRGHDHRVSTLLDIADALDCDVTITIVKRPAA
jgi:hypothetical protein